MKHHSLLYVNRFSIIWNSYIILLFIGCIISQYIPISNFNFIVLLYFSFLNLFLYSIKRINFFLTICLLLVSLTVFNLSVYTIFDILLILFVTIGLDISLTKQSLNIKTIINSSTLFVIASFIGIFFQCLYIEGDEGLRYGGLFHSINFSANIFAIISVCAWESKKELKNFCLENKDILWLSALICSIMTYIVFCGTRSMLFFIPYWIYQYYLFVRNIRYRSLVYILIFLLFILFLPTLYIILQEKLRFQENESSFATRAVLYALMVDGILDNWIVLPHGSHQSNLDIIRYTGDERFSPHNDLLSYLYDWGIIFIILIGYLIYNYKKEINLNYFLIIVGVSSFALHNMLFSVYIWIPLIVITLINFNYASTKYIWKNNFNNSSKI